MKSKIYIKNSNPIEFMVYDPKNIEKIKSFLKDDINEQISFAGKVIEVDTDWGTHQGGIGHVILKFDVGKYNLIESSVFKNNYVILENGKAIKFEKVEAIEYTGKNHLDVLLFDKGSVDLNNGGLAIKTSKGLIDIKAGDFIFKEVNGKINVNDKETFEKNFFDFSKLNYNDKQINLTEVLKTNNSENKSTKNMHQYNSNNSEKSNQFKKFEKYQSIEKTVKKENVSIDEMFEIDDIDYPEENLSVKKQSFSEKNEENGYNEILDIDNHLENNLFKNNNSKENENYYDEYDYYSDSIE